MPAEAKHKYESTVPPRLGAGVVFSLMWSWEKSSGLEVLKEVRKSVPKEKVEAVAEIRARLEKAPAVVLTNYRGINVATMTRLRKQMREAGIDYKVVKNTLAKRALDEMKIAGLDEFLEGPTAIAFSTVDPVAPARVIVSFMKDVKELEIKAGLLEKRFVSAEGVRALADLPSREVLLARVAGVFVSPLSVFASLLSAPMRNVAYGLEALRKQRESEGEAQGATTAS
jgi:large subunit ribosomal protein L10